MTLIVLVERVFEILESSSVNSDQEYGGIMTLEQLEFFYSKTEETIGESIPEGVVFTPISKAKALLLPLFKQLPAGNFTILEPSSGSGNLIIACLQLFEQLRVSPRRVRIVSVELDKSYSRLQKQFIQKHFPKWIDRIEFVTADFLFGFNTTEQFDFVVMNPPWIGYRQIESGTREKIKAKFGLSGQFDILDPFILKAFSSLKLDGGMGLFLPDKVVSSHQPGNALKIIQPRTKRLQITNLDVSFFENVQHESVFVKLFKSKSALTIAKNATESLPFISDYFDLFRGLEISGRSSEYLTSNKSDSVQGSRYFISGNEMKLDGKISFESPRYVSKKIPSKHLKKQFEYKGPAILVRKTGSPVHVSFVESLPLVSQVVFVLVPSAGSDVSIQSMKRLADFLASSEGQKLLQKNSGKLGRTLFPYVTIGDIKNVPIDPAVIGLRVKKAA